MQLNRRLNCKPYSSINVYTCLFTEFSTHLHRLSTKKCKF